jgi:hypothetical protein
LTGEEFVKHFVAESFPVVVEEFICSGQTAGSGLTG